MARTDKRQLDSNLAKLRDEKQGGNKQVEGVDDGASWSRTIRETIESIVIAFVLAFLFRTFEAEAFVIPTGSMAPTLVGKHLDIDCPMCGYSYRVGVVDLDELNGDGAGQPDRVLPRSCVCPNCRYQLRFDGADMTPAKLSNYPPYSGDRILVSKFAFDFAEPERWNVIVFKFPEDAKTNYIKRLIGLPGEIVRVRDGDIAVSHDNGRTFETAGKSPDVLRAMLQIVYDNDYAYEPFIAKGWPARWHTSKDGDGAWDNVATSGSDKDLKSFTTSGRAADGKTPATAWLRYDHYVPHQRDWDQFASGQAFDPPAAEPIYDFIAYDTGTLPDPAGNVAVSDLAMECEVNATGAEGEVTLELMKKGQPYACVFDLQKGSVRLEIPGRGEKDQPMAATGGLHGAGSYHVLVANVDHRLTVLINNKPVQFDKPATYDLGADEQGNPGAYDSSPARIGSKGAAVTISHLKLWRDVYYTYPPQEYLSGSPNYTTLFNDNPPANWPRPGEWRCYPEEKAKVLADAGAKPMAHDQYFFVGENQFFAMGDNSPLSSDGRLWRTQHFVDRKLLVGKALFIYWPHGFYRLHITKDFYVSLPWPLIPNFGKMGFVR